MRRFSGRSREVVAYENRKTDQNKGLFLEEVSTHLIFGR